MSNVKGQSGFTLVELMTVVAIIGILTTVITVNVSSARKEARDARRQADLRTIQTALEFYANRHTGQFPLATSGLESDSGTNWLPSLESLSAVPTDPLNVAPYLYHYRSDVSGNAYFLEATLELGTASDATLATPPGEAGFTSGSYYDETSQRLRYRVSSGSA